MECRPIDPIPVMQALVNLNFLPVLLDWFLRDLFFPHFNFFGTQELNSFNYLDLYRLADLFNLTLLEKAVIDFLVKHLSELLKSRPEDVLTLPYCLLQEVLKSDRLTSLSEEQIWQVRVLCMDLSWCGEGMKWLKVKGLRNSEGMLFGSVLVGFKSLKSHSPDRQVIGEHQPLRLRGFPKP